MFFFQSHYFCYYYTISMSIVLVLCMCFVSLMYFRKQLLISLLSLELLSLVLFFFILVNFVDLGQSISFSFYLLILSACEASLGLSLLVVMTRFKGNDLLNSISGLKY